MLIKAEELIRDYLERQIKRLTQISASATRVGNESAQRASDTLRMRFSILLLELAPPHRPQMWCRRCEEIFSVDKGPDVTPCPDCGADLSDELPPGDHEVYAKENPRT